MSGSNSNEKRAGATIWLLGIFIVVIVFGALIQDKPINIAVSDNPPSISTPVAGTGAMRTSMREEGDKSRSSVPLTQPGTQIFYGGWTVPQ
jgi:hypothetical protein